MAEKKKKLESSFSNMLIVLSVISLISAFALALTYSATLEPRQLGKLKKINSAIEQVVPKFDNKPNDEKIILSDGDLKDVEIFPVSLGGQSVGAAVKTYSDKGFSDRIWLMVGFDVNKKIINISVVDQKETPGLGTKMTAPEFIQQFKGKDPAVNVLKVKKDGGEIDALTAATISSRAFCDALQRACDAMNKGGVK